MEHAQGRGAAPALTYEEALGYLAGLGRFGVKLGLERSRAIVEQLGHPEHGLRGALIAGTNGKGSTAAFLASILGQAGLRVGTTPSPHLRSYTERIQLGGVPISEAEFAAAVSELRARIRPVVDRLGDPTEFEFLIGLALMWLGPRADRLVIEVGLGGRLDSTNVLDLGAAVITNVSLDHTQHLGGTVAAIAAEKAGVLKPGNRVATGASGEALAVIEAAAARARTRPPWRLGREITYGARRRGWAGIELDVAGPGFEHRGLLTPMLGLHQAENAALAVAAAHLLGDATAPAVRSGLAAVTWPGRLQRAGPRLLLDGGHNPEGLRRLAIEVRALIGREPVTVVFAAMADKDVEAMFAELRRLEPVAVVFTAAASAAGRAHPAGRLRELWGESSSPAQAVEPAAAALGRATELAGPDGWVLACGSLYLVGELL